MNDGEQEKKKHDNQTAEQNGCQPRMLGQPMVLNVLLPSMKVQMKKPLRLLNK